MKLLSKLVIYLFYLGLVTPAAFANVYRIVLDNYTINPATSNVTGTLEGYIEIDETIALNNTSTYLDTTSDFQLLSNLPWITAASLTFTRTGGDVDSPTITRTLSSASPFFSVNWRVTSATATAGGLDFDQDFVPATL